MDQPDRLAGQTSWTDQLDRPAGQTSWTDQLDRPARQISWTDQFSLFEALASSHIIRRLTFQFVHCHSFRVWRRPCYLISWQPSIRFSYLFFILKTEIHTKILNTNPFLCDIRGWDIYKSKCFSETDQFIFILSHSGLKTAEFMPSSTNWPKMGPDSSQVAPSRPSSPKWLNRCFNSFHHNFCRRCS